MRSERCRDLLLSFLSGWATERLCFASSVSRERSGCFDGAGLARRSSFILESVATLTSLTSLGLGVSFSGSAGLGSCASFGPLASLPGSFESDFTSSATFLESEAFVESRLIGWMADAGLVLLGGGARDSSISTSGALVSLLFVLSRSRSASASCSSLSSSSFESCFLVTWLLSRSRSSLDRSRRLRSLLSRRRLRSRSRSRS